MRKMGGTPEVDLNSNNPLFAVGDHVAVRYVPHLYTWERFLNMTGKMESTSFPSYNKSFYYSNGQKE